MYTRLLFSVSVCITTWIGYSHTVPTMQFEAPIDAVSFTLTNTAVVPDLSYFDGNNWIPWLPLHVDTDSEPSARETNLVIFPEQVTKIRLRNAGSIVTTNPLYSDHKPPSYTVAARASIGAPRILQRRQWGADESLAVRTSLQSRATSERGETSTSEREVECNQLQARYPSDFATTKTVDTNTAGQPLVWARRYSPEVKALVVHHTASTYSTDTRSGWDKMKLLYQYHTKSKGWGDVGYHYIIDENGQMYEGRAGGDYVVGGHAYCNNVGTVGIALMGNFSEEHPTVDQTRSLQWLLIELGQKYDINHDQKTRYHGEFMDTIVGHKDVLSTECPGTSLHGALPQIRQNVRSNSYRSSVRYPPVQRVFRGRTSGLNPSVSTPLGNARAATQVLGETELSVRPGGSVTIQVRVSAWTQPISRRQSVATVTRSDSEIGLWQYYPNGIQALIRDRLLATKTLQPGQSVTLPVRIQIPRQSGIYSVKIGDTTVRLEADGRRVRSVTNTRVSTNDTKAVSQRGRSTVTAITESSTSRPVFYRAKTPVTIGIGPTIRIKLSYFEDTATIQVGGNGTLDGRRVTGDVRFKKGTGRCIAESGGITAQAASPRLTSDTDTLTVSSWDTKFNQFRGTIECQIEAEKLILINELPLEHYLWGLAEEPDTEPYEKQRAFAIAARSYAAHYMQPQYRKFPGKQYDGNDSPANFQKYSGRAFEEANSRWIEAVNSTSTQVLIKNGQIVKAAYFSSDDGRTRSPAENGWPNFLFAEVFTSKPDPWCAGMANRGHGVGMSGCGAKGQANEGKTAEEILEYYYPGTYLEQL